MTQHIIYFISKLMTLKLGTKSDSLEINIDFIASHTTIILYFISLLCVGLEKKKEISVKMATVNAI